VAVAPVVWPCPHPSPASSREALAALRAPTRENPAAAGGFHALAEAMAPLANDPARLISTLHVSSPRSSWPGTVREHCNTVFW
jgi:hypothetical protein